MHANEFTSHHSAAALVNQRELKGEIEPFSGIDIRHKRYEQRVCGYAGTVLARSVFEAQPQIVSNGGIDRSRQLGTGKFDEGVSVEFSKWIGRWYTFVDTGYVFQGKSARYDLKEYMTYNAGVGYQITDKLRPGVTMKGSSAITHGSGSWLEPGVNLFYKFAAHAGIELHLGKGVTRSSPDYNAGLTVLYEF